MSFAQLKESIGDHGKDIRLNLESVLSEDGAPGLSRAQVLGVALASAYATQHPEIIRAALGASEGVLTEEEIRGAKSAATIMAMNNVYYRFLHLADDKEFSKLPARLRMNVIGNPGIPKVDFELMSLAVSALSGCGTCVNAHVNEVRRAGISNEGIQSAVRIASVINAAKQAVVIG